jgi:hypothetical protein
MPRRFASGLAALGLLLGSCDRGPTSPPECSGGARPEYFVPHDPAGPLLLLGCARVGGKRVEFSGSVDRIDGRGHVCIHPAYDGRGQRGFYIPAVWTRRRSASRSSTMPGRGFPAIRA